MPSILVELGYISNRQEENYLKSESGQTSLARSIFNGFTEYKREHDKKSHVFGSTSVTTPRNVDASTSNVPSGNREFRIQFLTSSRKLENGSAELKGLSPVRVYQDGNAYKYTYGNTGSHDEIRRMLREVQKKFKDAFIVEFSGEQRVK